MLLIFPLRETGFSTLPHIFHSFQALSHQHCRKANASLQNTHSRLFFFKYFCPYQRQKSSWSQDLSTKYARLLTLYGLFWSLQGLLVEALLCNRVGSRYFYLPISVVKQQKQIISTFHSFDSTKFMVSYSYTACHRVGSIL